MSYAMTKPSHKDFGRLSKYLRKEKGIRELERTTPERLAAQYEKGMMEILFTIHYGCDARKGYPIACAVLWETADPNTLEIGTVWVHPEHRGGNGGQNGNLQENVIKKLLGLPAAQGKCLFGISLIPTFGAIVQEQGFLPMTLEKMPDVEGWAKRVGMPVSRIPSSIYRPPHLGPPQGERVLYLRSHGE